MAQRAMSCACNSRVKVAMRRCAFDPFDGIRTLVRGEEYVPERERPADANRPVPIKEPSVETLQQQQDRMNRAVEFWTDKVNPRAYTYIDVEGGVERTLRNLAEGVKDSMRFREICATENERCVIWGGYKTHDHDPMVKLVRPDGDIWIYANRAVAFLFADDESYAVLHRLDPRNPLKMTCGNRQCICLGHMSKVSDTAING